MQPLQICIGPTICIGRESWCLPYAGFFWITSLREALPRKNLLFDNVQIEADFFLG